MSIFGKILISFIFLVTCHLAFCQNNEIFFSTKTETFDTLIHLNSKRITKGDTTLQIPFNFNWYSKKQDSINIGPSGFSFYKCFIGAPLGEFFAFSIGNRPFNNGLNGAEVRYEVSGSLGNKVLKIEGKNIPSNYSKNDKINIITKFFEFDNHIEFQFGEIDVLNWDSLRIDTTFGAPNPEIGFPAFDLAFYFDCAQLANHRFGSVYDSSGQYYLRTTKSSPFPPNEILNNQPAPGTTFIFKQGVLSTSSNLAGIQNELIVYPNPNKGNFSIKGLDLNSEVKIYDVMGRVVFNKIANNQTMQINLPKGLYVLQVINGDKLQVKKVICK